MDRYRSRYREGGDTRDIKDMVRYRQDTGEIQAEYPKNTRQGRASIVCAHTLLTMHNECAVSCLMFMSLIYHINDTCTTPDTS